MMNLDIAPAKPNEGVGSNPAAHRALPISIIVGRSTAGRERRARKVARRSGIPHRSCMTASDATPLVQLLILAGAATWPAASWCPRWCGSHEPDCRRPGCRWSPWDGDRWVTTLSAPNCATRCLWTSCRRSTASRTTCTTAAPTSAISPRWRACARRSKRSPAAATSAACATSRSSPACSYRGGAVAGGRHRSSPRPREVAASAAS